MSEFSDKIRKGALPSDQDWENHLVEAHAREPRMTPEAFAGFRTQEGLNSYEILAAELPLPPRDLTVIDLACGDGHLIPYLLPRLGSASKIVGVDISLEGLEIARKEIRDSRVGFALGRAQQMPVENASVDFVLCHMAFMLMSPVEEVLAEIHRVLKPGGKFSAVISGGETEGFYKHIRRLCGLFVQAHLPRFHESRSSQIEVSKFQVRPFKLRYYVSPEGVWDYLRNMYFIPMMPEPAQRELKDELMALARDYQDESGKILFFVPMQLLAQD
jgi:ubiquinone/menaquinone biosynthesis C-methylase UbiE